MKGFVAPRDGTGQASLYGPPPWHFAGRSITVLAVCDADGIAALVPAPLVPVVDAPVRISVHELFCDLGKGREWAQAHPAEARFREAVVGIAVTCQGRVGYWDPFLWTDSDAEMAVGREFYGWPQRLGGIALTAPHPLDGWRHGDRAAGLVSRAGEAALRLDVAIEAPSPLDVASPPFAGFFLERLLPDPVDGTRVRDVLFAPMRDVRVHNAWSGAATLTLLAPELAVLGKPAPLGGQVHAIAWTKDRVERLFRETLPSL